MTLGHYEQCKICKEYGFTDIHKCPPLYRVREPDMDWVDIYADDSIRAAEKYCAKSDDFDHSDYWEAIIVKTPEGEYEAFVVNREMEPVYSAHHPYHGEQFDITEDMKADTPEDEND